MDNKRIGPGSKFYLPVEVPHPVPPPCACADIVQCLPTLTGSCDKVPIPASEADAAQCRIRADCWLWLMTQVNGGLFQAGDCHGTQGDSEYDGETTPKLSSFGYCTDICLHWQWRCLWPVSRKPVVLPMLCC